MDNGQSKKVKQTSRTTKATPPQPLSQADLAILAAIQRFHYLTAAQVSRLLYPGCHDGNRYARRRLARLVEARLLLRLTSLPAPRHGSAPHVFTLARAGRELLAATDTYFRPSEEFAKARNHLFMDHTLATIDVLIAAELLCRTHPVTIPRLLTERELRHVPTRVTLPAVPGRAVRSVAVIPDAWFELEVAGRQPVAIALELDRGTEDQQRWRAKVEALAAWAVGPYRQAFAADTLTIAVLTPDPARRQTLRTWTARELAHRNALPLAEIFLFSSVDPITVPPQALFFDPCWYEPLQRPPVGLLLPPPQPVADKPRSAEPGAVQEVWPAGG